MPHYGEPFIAALYKVTCVTVVVVTKSTRVLTVVILEHFNGRHPASSPGRSPEQEMTAGEEVSAVNTYPHTGERQVDVMDELDLIV